MTNEKTEIIVEKILGLIKEFAPEEQRRIGWRINYQIASQFKAPKEKKEKKVKTKKVSK